ncbi:hypothetical protein H7F15_06960 [Pontibacter sp. Tf4]|uniref:hypothetical protein n=1 Tax=Pontibacter sp. Tf4 TaxID=2761620 RepID=UPI001625AD55|nr:hypothetical protein [Pontibacter sp. Tf4]MBB6610772.1 hypothetical protein [Pontibacter sp. Tf4]
METWMPLITSAVVLGTFILYMALLVFILTWVYHDAELRGVNGWLVTAITFLTGTIAGTFVWLLFRPKLKPQPISSY